MPINLRKNFLLAYDIADPDRLVRVHRKVRQWGIPLQYSVFLVPASPASLDVLLADLAGIIRKGEDDIRVYPIPKRVEWTQFGRQVLPDGIELIGDRLSMEDSDKLLGSRLGE